VGSENYQLLLEIHRYSNYLKVPFGLLLKINVAKSGCINILFTTLLPHWGIDN